MHEDYQFFPLHTGRIPLTKQWCVERAREWLRSDVRAPIGIYKLVAIVRAHSEVTIEEVDVYE